MPAIELKEIQHKVSALALLVVPASLQEGKVAWDAMDGVLRMVIGWQ